MQGVSDFNLKVLKDLVDMYKDIYHNNLDRESTGNEEAARMIETDKQFLVSIANYIERNRKILNWREVIQNV